MDISTVVMIVIISGFILFLLGVREGTVYERAQQKNQAACQHEHKKCVDCLKEL